ncbi:isocitrate lyase [Mycobacterium tuberculosis]|nr:isocitrate lyase [Mycobacterium tuberculosis]
MSVVGTPKSAEQIQQEWDTNPRWKDVTRTYSAEDVVALQGSVVEEHTLARRGRRCCGSSCTTSSGSTRWAR